MKNRAQKRTRDVRRSLAIGCWPSYEEMAASNTSTSLSQRPVTASEMIERIRRYNELCILADEACWVASQDPILYEKLKTFFLEYGDGEDGHENSISQDAQTCEGPAPIVADPIQVSDEGALSATQKVYFKKTPRDSLIVEQKPSTREARHCSLCREPGHNIRKCKQNPKNQ